MWQKFETFIAVAVNHSFIKTAEQLNLSKATVTRYIKELEEEYQTVLFTRTTRHVNLTEQGEQLYHHFIELLQLNQQLRETVLDQSTTIKGKIKIGLPVSIMALFIENKITSLCHEYPELNIEIVQGNHLTNLLSHHFDLVIHCGLLPDVNFYYSTIASWQRVLCASPAYLKNHKKIKSIHDLKQHQCLDHADNHSVSWYLMEKNKSIEIPIKTNITVNSSMALKSLALQGLGITYLPSFTIFDELKNKSLIRILPKASPPEMKIYALYPVRKQNNRKIDIIIQALKACLN